MLHGGYSGKHSPSTASPQTGLCTLLGFDGLGKTRAYDYMLLTFILCRAIALPFYNLVVVENLQTGPISAIGTSGPTRYLSAASDRASGRKMSQDRA
jgi:hypothetical protein